MLPDKRSDRERELELEYLRQGVGIKQAAHKAKAQYVREYVSDLKTSDPVEYARLTKMVNDVEFAEQQREVKEREHRRALAAQQRRVDGALLDARVPLPQLDLSDFITFRAWDIAAGGELHGVGVGSGYMWREFNVADRVPTYRNQHGLYCVNIDAQSLVAGKIGNYFNSKAAGLVALSGDIVDHTDGVLRAEVARILCIWYMPPIAGYAFVDVPGLMHVYPTTPVYVTTPRYAADALLRVAVMLEWRRGKGFGGDVGFARQPDDEPEVDDFVQFIDDRGHW